MNTPAPRGWPVQAWSAATSTFGGRRPGPRASSTVANSPPFLSRCPPPRYPGSASSRLERCNSSAAPGRPRPCCRGRNNAGPGPGLPRSLRFGRFRRPSRSSGSSGWPRIAGWNGRWSRQRRAQACPPRCGGSCPRLDIPETALLTSQCYAALTGIDLEDAELVDSSEALDYQSVDFTDRTHAVPFETHAPAWRQCRWLMPLRALLRSAP